MSKTRVFTPENRLANILQANRGAGANELISNAQARVAELGPSIRRTVLDRVERILSMSRDGGIVAPSDREALGATALEVAELAGAVGLRGLGEVACGISAMVDCAGAQGVWRPEAVTLHLDALRLLQKGGGQAQGEEQMLARLRVLRTAIGVPQ